MPKSKIKKKGCRSREKVVKPQAQTACQKAKSRKRDAGAWEKPTIPKRKRHAKKQNQEKGMPEPGKSRQAPSTNGMPKSKIKKKGCRGRGKVGKPQKHKRHAKKQNQEKGMPEPRKSRQASSAYGLPKSKIKKKGCRSRGKVVNPQAQTACQKAKSRKKDAETGEKPANLNHKRHAKKQNQEKRMPEPGESRQAPSINGMPKRKIKKKGCRSRKKAGTPQAQTACKKAKSRKRDAGTGEKSSSPKHKRHVKINKIINNMLRYK